MDGCLVRLAVCIHCWAGWPGWLYVYMAGLASAGGVDRTAVYNLGRRRTTWHGEDDAMSRPHHGPVMFAGEKPEFYEGWRLRVKGYLSKEKNKRLRDEGVGPLLLTCLVPGPPVFEAVKDNDFDLLEMPAGENHIWRVLNRKYLSRPEAEKRGELMRTAHPLCP